MLSSSDDLRAPVRVETTNERGERAEADEWKPRRWLVAFRSGTSWYDVGEFVAVDAAGAVECAVAVFGPSEEHRAEEVPWDAAPLIRMNQR
jgi:hypothetical protein